MGVSTYILYFQSELPRITMPQSMVQRIMKEKEKRSEEFASKKQKGPVRISCKRKQFNHHSGQKYSDFTPQVLASGGWKHRKSKGDQFTMHAMSSVSLYITLLIYYHACLCAVRKSTQ